MSYLIHSFDFQWERIQQRTRVELDTLHIVERNGMFKCLDLDISANSLSLLKIAIKETIDKFGFNEKLPHSPKHEWQEIWGNKMEWRRVLPEIKHPNSNLPLAAILTRL
jgi:hypothetical protein